jgi:hypothetical protein
MVLNILCFLLVPVINLLLFLLSFYLPIQHWDWFVYGYHAIEVIVILLLLVCKSSPQVKKAALFALIGGLIGCYIEWLMVMQFANMMFDAVTNGLA